MQPRAYQRIHLGHVAAEPAERSVLINPVRHFLIGRVYMDTHKSQQHAPVIIRTTCSSLKHERTPGLWTAMQLAPRNGHAECLFKQFALLQRVGFY